MQILYRAFIGAYLLAIRCSATVGNSKARRWLEGRRNLLQQLSTLPGGEKRIWFHCASLGEFEQGRPLIEKMKTEFPGMKIVLTFFSPSGYEIRKGYPGADYIFYLPLDSEHNAEAFIRHVNPAIVFFIKYDYWYYFLRELYRKEIPVCVVSAVFRHKQVFFKWYGSFFRKMLRMVTMFFLQDQSSANLLDGIGIRNHIVSGDTRFDRVVTAAAEPKSFAVLDTFAKKDLIVAGSTWPNDEKLLRAVLHEFPSMKMIIAPHEVNSERIAEIRNFFPDSTLFSEMKEKGTSERIVIVDTIGLLSSLYRCGGYAYIGGGFGKGIHNTLEAAVYGKPVFFGTEYSKFRDARELIAAGGAYSVKDGQEMISVIRALVQDSGSYERSCEASAAYVAKNAGATGKVMAWLRQHPSGIAVIPPGN